MCRATHASRCQMLDLLEFDVEDHAYSVKGVRLPSVTQIMGTQFPLNVPKERLEFARQMGRAIHSATELYDRGDLDFDTVDPRVVPYLEAWIKFLRETSCKVVSVEERVMHPFLRYAGTLDRTVRMAGIASLCVLDLKRPVLGPRVGVQLAAYAGAYNQGKARPDQVLRRFGIQLRADGNYRLHEYKDGADWSVFIAALTIHNWRQQHGE